MQYLSAAFAMATASYSLNPTLTLWKGFEVVTHVSVVAVLSRKIGSVDDALSMLGLSWIVLSFVAISLIVSIIISPEEALYQIPCCVFENAYISYSERQITVRITNFIIQRNITDTFANTQQGI